jgi:bifunctional non-homologous end joining protein LigD
LKSAAGESSEMHGVLKSWAVPKGPSTTKDEARLARATEDHPLVYLDFEGIIPRHQYGGGTVMVWDIGTWQLIEDNYYKGFLRFHLEARKLSGEWLLRADRERESWRLVRSGPGAESVIAGDDDRSAITGRTMAEIAAAADAVWQSNRAESAASARAGPQPLAASVASDRPEESAEEARAGKVLTRRRSPSTPGRRRS